jgi:hypothetical protein
MFLNDRKKPYTHKPPIRHAPSISAYAAPPQRRSTSNGFDYQPRGVFVFLPISDIRHLA